MLRPCSRVPPLHTQSLTGLHLPFLPYTCCTCPPQGVKYVCVAGRAVRGNRDADRRTLRQGGACTRGVGVQEAALSG